MAEVNRNRIILARESRGLTQAELAERIGTTQGNIGKLERNEYGISDEWLTAIAEATQYPVSFFYQGGGILPENLNYRKREKVAQSLLTPLHAKVNIHRMQLETLLSALSVPAPTLPDYEVTERNTPAVLANKLRKQWELPAGPVGNLTRILEDRGIIVCSFDFQTERVDSRCLLTEEDQPIIFINNSLQGDRRRFSLAYELGHLVMHSGGLIALERDTNHEANLFAAELLMPEKEIRKDFDPGVTVRLLASLKQKWKVSMISLLYRADDLGLLSPHQKRQLIQQFNELQIRRREPPELDVPIEKPQLIKQWLGKLRSTGKLSTADLAEKLHLHSDEFIALYTN